MDMISDFKRNIPTGEEVNEMIESYGIDPDKTFQCPACEETCGIMRQMITHLNDSNYSMFYDNTVIKVKGEVIKNHNWSFKQIGKWLEGLGY